MSRVIIQISAACLGSVSENEDSHLGFSWSQIQPPPWLPKFEDRSLGNPQIKRNTRGHEKTPRNSLRLVHAPGHDPRSRLNGPPVRGEAALQNCLATPERNIPVSMGRMREPPSLWQGGPSGATAIRSRLRLRISHTAGQASENLWIHEPSQTGQMVRPCTSPFSHESELHAWRTLWVLGATRNGGAAPKKAMVRPSTRTSVQHEQEVRRVDEHADS